MFGTIRIIFWSVIFGICIMLLKNKKRLSKKNVIIAVVIMVLLCTLSGMVPIENCFLTFSTPEKAFDYINSEKVALVVEGKETTLVIGEEGKADYVYLVLPKCSNGWKLGRGIDTKLKEQTMNEDIVISLYQYKESNDYYITILDMSGKNIEIIDSCDSSFVTFDNEEMDAGFTFYFYNVSHYDKNYWVKVNEEKFSFTK